MAGTIEGGKAAAATNKLKYGADYYARIGAEGGANGDSGGFASTEVGKDGLTGKERAKKYGQIGGRKGRRHPTSSVSQSSSTSASSSVSTPSTSPATPPKPKRRWWDIKR